MGGLDRILGVPVTDLEWEQYFSSSENEIYYGKVRVEYSAWEDDIAKPSKVG